MPNNHECIHKIYELINPSTIGPDFSVTTRERTKVPHPYHGGNKVTVKQPSVLCIRPHNGVGRAVVEQLLVRVQQPLLVQQVLEVIVVEAARRAVEGGEVAVAAGARAVLPAGVAEGDGDVGIVVDADTEVGAAGEADGVAPGEDDKVP